MKVNKEEMVGMLAALELFVGKDHAREATRVSSGARKRSARARRRSPGVKAEIFVPGGRQPRAARARDMGRGVRTGLKAAAVVRAHAGRRALHRDQGSEGETLVVGVWMMQAGEEKIVARRLRQELEKQHRSLQRSRGRSDRTRRGQDATSNTSLLLCLGLCLATSASAQLASQTALVGTVTDSGGLVVPGAQVVAVNVGTKDTYEATTNAEGYYNIQFVRTGTYDITVTLTGFQTFKATGVEVANNQVVRTNAVMKVGG